MSKIFFQGGENISRGANPLEPPVVTVLFQPMNEVNYRNRLVNSKSVSIPKLCMDWILDFSDPDSCWLKHNQE